VFQRESALRILAIASLAFTSCSVARQRVNLTVRGDVPTVDSPRKGPGAGARQARPAAPSRQVTAGIRCPVRIGAEVIGVVVPGLNEGPATCMNMANRDDREVVGGPLGVVASALPGLQCADSCTARISIAPIAAQLGKPPTPEQIAGRMARGRLADDRVRHDVRRAFDDEVHSRYRRYADYISVQLWDADWVEIPPPGGVGETRRYGRGEVDEGVRAALTEMAGSYAALEWARFERALAPEPDPKPEVAPRPDPAPAAPPPDAPARVLGAASDQPKAAEPPPPPAEARPATDPGPQVQKTAAAPAEVGTASNHVGCRRSCSLQYRSCLARCRDQPITGGGYDACTYECQDASVVCRGTCDMPTP
jgi:hypothetical protein